MEGQPMPDPKPSRKIFDSLRNVLNFWLAVLFSRSFYFCPYLHLGEEKRNPRRSVHGYLPIIQLYDSNTLLNDEYNN